jgi:energy-coupling factor transporter ATP-binding protein EcfA2
MIVRTLTQSRTDQRRFADRKAETQTIMQAVGDGQPVLVVGESGSGRSSLLNHAAWLLARQAEPWESVVVSGELARDPAQLLGVLVARLQRLAEPEAPRGRWLQELQALALPDGPFGDAAQPAILMELVDLLGDRLAALKRGVCLMIDGISPTVAHAVFGSLRNELWALEGVAWVVAGDAAAKRLYLEPPADAFFARTVELGPLDHADAAKLIRAHLPELSDEQIAQAVAADGTGNPRRLLRAAADIEAGASPTVAKIDAIAQRAAELAGPLAGRLVAYLADNGPAAASDQRLLRQVDASRQRVSQLMRQLESAGLLETLEAREPGRRGRPVRRFAVKEQS